MSTNYHQLLQDYWRRRLNPPRLYILIISAPVAFFSSEGLQKEGGEKYNVQVATFVQCLLIILLTLPSLWSSQYDCLVRFALMLCAVLPLQENLMRYATEGEYIRSFDGDRAAQETLMLCFKLFCSIVFFNFHLYNFNHKQRGHLMFGVFFMIYIICALQCACYGFDKVQIAEVAAAGMVILFPLGMLLLKNETEHIEEVQKMMKNISDQEFLRLVLNTNPAALAILNEDCKITFSNKVFYELFQDHLCKAMEGVSELDPNLAPGAVAENKTKKADLCGFFQFIRELASFQQKLHEIPNHRRLFDSDNLNQIQQFGAFPKAQDNFESHFYDFQIFEAIDNPGSESDGTSNAEPTVLSFRKIFQNPQIINDRTFKVIEISEKAEADLEEGRVRVKPSRFVKFDIKSLEYLEQKRLLVQIKDVSDGILYGQSKEQNEMLSILNATVSHELRNPLNAIAGQNIQKEGLYQQLIENIRVLEREDNTSNNQIASAMHSIMDRLYESLNVQDSSTRLMSFLVQDFLDYAQIKSGKFRMNVKPFDVREMLDKVISIQQQKALEQGIVLRAEFENMEVELPDLESEIEAIRPSSAVVCTDEQRVMQVLLNLQSNALKFTRSGSVDIRAKVIEEEEARYLHITVEDTGVGIPYSDQGKLFKLFGFVSTTEQYNRNGIGLGLVISEKIVTKFGGQISFKSVPCPEEGHGTTFTFTFKLEVSPDEGLESRECPSEEKMTLNSKHLVFDLKSRGQPTGLLDSRILCERSFANSVNHSINSSRASICMFDCAQEGIPLQVHSESHAFVRDEMLPAVREEVREQIIAGRAQIVTRRPLRKILIVDDQIFNIQALMAIFEHRFNISEDQLDYALNGEEALKKIQEDLVNFPTLPQKHGASYDAQDVPCSFPLILMDCNMPFMDGYECTELIREHFKTQYRASMLQQPIISAVTGHVEKQYIQKCFQAGMNQVLSKPVEEASLLAACVQAGLTTCEKVAAFQALKRSTKK